MNFPIVKLAPATDWYAHAARLSRLRAPLLAALALNALLLFGKRQDGHVQNMDVSPDQMLAEAAITNAAPSRELVAGVAQPDRLNVAPLSQVQRDNTDRESDTDASLVRENVQELPGELSGSGIVDDSLEDILEKHSSTSDTPHAAHDVKVYDESPVTDTHLDLQSDRKFRDELSGPEAVDNLQEDVTEEVTSGPDIPQAAEDARAYDPSRAPDGSDAVTVTPKTPTQVGKSAIGVDDAPHTLPDVAAVRVREGQSALAPDGLSNGFGLPIRRFVSWFGRGSEESYTAPDDSPGDAGASQGATSVESSNREAGAVGGEHTVIATNAESAVHTDFTEVRGNQPVQSVPTLINSQDSGGVIHYLVNDEVHSLAPGQSHRLTSEGPFLVHFHRGAEFGNSMRHVSEGTYRFCVTERGWELSPAQQAADAD